MLKHYVADEHVVSQLVKSVSKNWEWSDIKFPTMVEPRRQMPIDGATLLVTVSCTS